MTVKLDLSPHVQGGVHPARTHLLDKSCRPDASDGTRVLYSFPLNSCGSTVKVAVPAGGKHPRPVLQIDLSVFCPPAGGQGICDVSERSFPPLRFSGCEKSTGPGPRFGKVPSRLSRTSGCLSLEPQRTPLVAVWSYSALIVWMVYIASSGPTRLSRRPPVSVSSCLESSPVGVCGPPPSA